MSDGKECKCGAYGEYFRRLVAVDWRSAREVALEVENKRLKDQLKLEQQIDKGYHQTMTVEIDMIDHLAKDNKALKEAGARLSEAAFRVATEYDGVHRLMLAVSGWAKAIANEGGRAELYSSKPTERTSA